MRYARSEGKSALHLQTTCSICALFVNLLLIPDFVQTVSFEEGETLAREYNIHFFETSAKQDMNVEKSFITIATDVKDRLMVDGGSGGACSGIVE